MDSPTVHFALELQQFLKMKQHIHQKLLLLHWNIFFSDCIDKASSKYLSFSVISLLISIFSIFWNLEVCKSLLCISYINISMKNPSAVHKDFGKVWKFKGNQNILLSQYLDGYLLLWSILTLAFILLWRLGTVCSKHVLFERYC